MGSVEIICSECGQESILLRKTKYDGFTKTGETLVCSSCGFEYENEEAVPFKQKTEETFFTDADRSKEIAVFSENEASSLCRYCTYYVVNPFMQWCSHHKKEVEATDTCTFFEVEQEEEKKEEL